MAKVVKAIWSYPDINISDRMRTVINNQGLITPLVIGKDDEIHWRHREKYMAFVSESKKLETKDIKVLVVHYNDLTSEEKDEFN